MLHKLESSTEYTNIKNSNNQIMVYEKQKFF